MAELEGRVGALEERVREMSGLLEGHEPWSHRSRLHALEGSSQSARLASEALAAYRRERDQTGRRIREWGSFALAAAAILVSLLR